MTLLLPLRMHPPELLLTQISSDTQVQNPVSDTKTHRAISNQSQWLLCPALMEVLTSAMLSYFHPPQIFRQPQEIRQEEKMSDQEHETQLSLQTFNSFHLASQFAESRDHLLCNEKVGLEREWSLLRKQPSALSVAFRNCQFGTVKMQAFWVITILSLHATSTYSYATAGGGLGVIFIAWGNITIGKILCIIIVTDIKDIKTWWWITMR